MQDRTTLPEAGPAGPPPGATLGKRQGLSRRNLLGTLGVAAAGSALGLVSYRDDAQAATTPKGPKASEHAWCMVIDLRTCDGCKLCTIACQQRHQLREEQTWIKVYDMKDSSGGTFPMPGPA